MQASTASKRESGNQGERETEAAKQESLTSSEESAGDGLIRDHMEKREERIRTWTISALRAK